MRDRLIELLKEIEKNPRVRCPKYDDLTCEGCKYDLDKECDIAAITADHLLAEGVIVPPCNIGDTVYQPLHGKILEYKVLSWCVREWGVHITTHSMQTGALHPIRGDYVGKTVFLAREEAEAALAQREGKA